MKFHKKCLKNIKVLELKTIKNFEILIAARPTSIKTSTNKSYNFLRNLSPKGIFFTLFLYDHRMACDPSKIIFEN